MLSFPSLPRLLFAARPELLTLVHSGALVEDASEHPAQPHLAVEPDGEDALTQLEDASIRYRIAVGPLEGARTFACTPLCATSRATCGHPNRQSCRYAIARLAALVPRG